MSHEMILRILAWCAVIFGGAISVESTFVAHRPNLVWILVFILGIGYFIKNGFFSKPKPPESGR